MKQSKIVELTHTEVLIILALAAGKTRRDIIAERGITPPTWFSQIATLRGKLTGGWKDDAPAVISMTRQLLTEIEEITTHGKHTLVQKDVISSRALMREIILRGKCLPCAPQVAQALSAFGMVSVGRLLLVGERHCLWALPGIDRNHAVVRVHARMLPASALNA